jgi:hypothetical protein
MFKADNLNATKCSSAEPPYGVGNKIQVSIDGKLHTFTISATDLFYSISQGVRLYVWEPIPEFSDKTHTVELFHEAPKVQIRAETLINEKKLSLQNAFRASFGTIDNKGKMEIISTPLDVGSIKNQNILKVDGIGNATLKSPILDNKGSLTLKNVKESAFERVENQGELKVEKGSFTTSKLHNQKNSCF